MPQILHHLRTLKTAATAYFGARPRTPTTIATPAALREYLDSRASFVAQTTLYGYMKTRAGTSFPDLFATPALVDSINIAKWQVYLACLSDLTVYAGVLLTARTAASPSQIRAQLAQLIGEILNQTGTPPDAGADFASSAKQLRARIAAADFTALADDDSAFTQSPAALVYWSPVSDAFKKRDTVIVRNSVRFRWQEIRRDLRRRLRADDIIAGGLR